MAPTDLCARALLAYSVYEHQQGDAQHIDVWVRPGTFIVQDDGRGMGLDRDGYVEGLMGVLVGHGGAIHLHGVGLSLVAAMSPRLEIESRRNGTLFRQSFSWGASDGPPCEGLNGPEVGTRITLTTSDPSFAFDLESLTIQIDVWLNSNPKLTITVH
jgi:DNA gyrase/topoisomerase IV subunit B